MNLSELTGFHFAWLKTTVTNFLGDERYFLRSPANKHLLTDPYLEKYFAENLKKYAEQKKAFQEKTGDYNGEPYFSKYDGLFLNSLGGERIEGSNWSTSDDIPSAYKNDARWRRERHHYPQWQSFLPYRLSVSVIPIPIGADNIVMLYEPISRLVLFTYDWT